MREIIVGVDEVGRGCMVGSVVAAAVVLPEKYLLPKLNDSKKLTEKQREKLYVEIKSQALDIAVAEVPAWEIDEINIRNAALKAMRLALAKLKIKATMALIDGNAIPDNLNMPAQSIVKGDSLYPEISAASIIAKVTRDRQMYELDKKYPQYNFAKHKGYVTKIHQERILEFGIIPEHRKSFEPIKTWLNKGIIKIADD